MSSLSLDSFAVSASRKDWIFSLSSLTFCFTVSSILCCSSAKVDCTISLFFTASSLLAATSSILVLSSVSSSAFLASRRAA